MERCDKCPYFLKSDSTNRKDFCRYWWEEKDEWDIVCDDYDELMEDYYDDDE